MMKTWVSKDADVPPVVNLIDPSKKQCRLTVCLLCGGQDLSLIEN